MSCELLRRTTGQSGALNKYRFINHPELQRIEFAPHRLPQREGNMNGWLIKDEDEPLEHEASDNEVDSDLESTIVTQVTNNMNNANGGNSGNGKNGGNNGCTYKGFMACNLKEYDGKGETDDEFAHGDEQVNNDEEEEMKNAKVEESEKGDAEISDVAKVDAKNIEEIKDDAKKAELSPTSSGLSVSLVLTPIHETPLVDPATTLLTPSSVSNIPHVPHQITAPIPTPPITTEASTITIVVPESDVLQRHTADLVQKYSVKPASESSKILKPTIILNKNMRRVIQRFARLIGNKLRRKRCQSIQLSLLTRNPANHALYHALLEALIEDENDMDKGVADIVKNHKRQHDDDDKDPLAGPNQDDAVNTTREYVVRDDDQPQDTLEPKTYKTPNQDWFKQPLSPPTPDSE
nr:hypothetical protein [Tanacetum cinerariifolium]